MHSTWSYNVHVVHACRAWRDGGELPFLLDNVRDLQRVLDYLEGQPFVDAARIGMAGVSLGGMHTWLCAAIDGRVAAAAPLIGVQGFQWAISNHAYHARVESLSRAFQLIAKECGKVKRHGFSVVSGSLLLRALALYQTSVRGRVCGITVAAAA
jgi:poly(3-hydroxybutyrate) depolymerase